MTISEVLISAGSTVAIVLLGSRSSVLTSISIARMRMCRVVSGKGGAAELCDWLIASPTKELDAPPFPSATLRNLRVTVVALLRFGRYFKISDPISHPLSAGKSTAPQPFSIQIPTALRLLSSIQPSFII